jgi:hypothetical protein
MAARSAGFDGRRRRFDARRARLLALSAVAVLLIAGCSAVPNLDQGGMGCQNAGDGVQRTGNPTDPGQPLAGVDVIDRSPADIGRIAEAQGLIVRYHLDYSTDPGGGGYGECWCTPPNEGHVNEVFWGSNGQLFVVAYTDMKPGGREQPTFGWGCQGLFG